MTMKLVVEAEFYSTMETFKRAGWLAMEDVVSFRICCQFIRVYGCYFSDDDSL
jgi:hypothetical protein